MKVSVKIDFNGKEYNLFLIYVEEMGLDWDFRVVVVIVKWVFFEVNVEVFDFIFNMLVKMWYGIVKKLGF